MLDGESVLLWWIWFDGGIPCGIIHRVIEWMTSHDDTVVDEYTAAWTKQQ